MSGASPGRSKIRVALWCLAWLVVCSGLAEGLLRADVPWRYPALEPHVLRSKRDAYAHNGFEIQRVRRRDGGDAVVLLGGSTGLLALEDDAAFGDRLGERLGRPVSFHSVCATYQVFTDDAQIVHELGAFDGTVLLAVDALRFTKSADQQLVYTDREGRPVRKYYYLPTPRPVLELLAEQGVRPPWHQRVLLPDCVIGLGGMEKKRFRDLVREGTYARREFDRLYISREIPADAERIVEIRQMLRDNVAEYERWHELNFALLDAVIAEARFHGNHVVIVELPHNPVFAEEFAALPGYDARMAALVAGTGVGYVDLRDAAEWGPKDFRDAHHLRSSGRVKFAAALLDALPGELVAR